MKVPALKKKLDGAIAVSCPEHYEGGWKIIAIKNHNQIKHYNSLPPVYWSVLESTWFQVIPSLADTQSDIGEVWIL